MKIFNILKPETIFLGVSIADKDAALHFIADAYAKSAAVGSPDPVYAGLKERESLMSTGIGNSIGIPHALSTDIRQPALMIIRLNPPVEFDALDRKPVDILFPLLIPESRPYLHLQILAGISRLCKQPDFSEAIRHAQDPVKLIEDIKDLEETIAFH